MVSDLPQLTTFYVAITRRLLLIMYSLRKKSKTQYYSFLLFIKFQHFNSIEYLCYIIMFL